MGPRVLLGDALPQQVGHVLLPQRLLQPGLPRGVDPLPDEHRLPAKLHRLDARGHHRPLPPGHRRAGEGGALLHHLGQVFRGGAAAAPHRLGPGLYDLRHQRPEFLRPHVIAGLALPLGGQPRVGVHNHRQRGELSEPPGQAQHLLGPQPAVQAQCVHPQALQHGHGSLQAPPGQQLPGLVKGHGDVHRQAGALLRRQHRGLHLVQVAHGLDEHAVRPGGSPCLHHLPKGGHGLLKGQVPHGGQQLPCGAHVQRHRGLFPGLRRSLPGQGDPGGHQLGGGHPQLPALDGVGPKGVAFQHLGPGL